ncbi:AraC family transcriptional regulator [Deinococcus metallilatus]|uniref:AraC family transcriptional regulator n=1 Tax=Deinococcus metallilatus TaxID=1211322 RepID=A0AAJ5F687_9DEIO|nr:helix-turn-helix domain-containing protein [Deinococcus metallilatus]MBB5294389.1 AraC-like DNA-binding protein [Deinococcus metallilatus]QBY10144.1 AraC family transcriptional regulator [Deinococcus metallilatus]RXJ13870.1 AraC family transcriptional regulator [Deinococcus metallilatus]TLK29836.1 AraC family transcriptional regulator [Deinococcus metallilatus]GMA15605.1 AraC family transcriptional regulator [Deinococcus metallilatus]
MPFQEFLPDPRLRPLVRVYWQMEELHDAGQEEHRFLPERSVRLTFLAGSSWRGAVNGGSLQPLPEAALGGLTLQPLRVVSVGHTRALGVELYPWGARQLLGWHAGMPDLDLGEQYGADVRAVCALLHLELWEEARQTLEGWLLRLWAERAVETGKGVRAAAQLYTSLGSARIGTLADELNLSPRQLERQFVREVGVKAKTLARLIRFEEIHNRLLLNPALPLAPLAYELGFADQAHLTREFRALSQMTPRTFAQWAEKRWRPVWERELAGALVQVPGVPLVTAL